MHTTLMNIHLHIRYEYTHIYSCNLSFKKTEVLVLLLCKEIGFNIAISQ